MIAVTSVVLAFFAFLMTCLSAYFAWNASKRPIIPSWVAGPATFEPADPVQSQIGWTIGAQIGRPILLFKQASDLLRSNRRRG